MTAPNVYMDPENKPGQSLYEHAADGYVGPKPWPKWKSLSKKEKASWAKNERDVYGKPSAPRQ